MENRSILSFGWDVKALNETGEIEGLGSVFNNVDRGGDIVDPAAFTDTLKAWQAKGKLPKMLWQHDPSQPVGVWEEMRVVDGGLFCKGRILVDLPEGKRVHTLVKAGAVDGLSIGFNIIDFEYEGNGRVRRLKELELWEVSLVTFPMNELAGVTGIKAVPDEREFERKLRDAEFSARQAKTAVSVYKALVRDDGQAARDAGDEAENVKRMDALRELQRKLQSLTEVSQ